MRLDAINPDYPQLRAQVNTSFAVPIDMYLYKGGALERSQFQRARGVPSALWGEQLVHPHVHEHQRMAASPDTNYCLQAVTRDGETGGGAHGSTVAERRTADGQHQPGSGELHGTFLAGVATRRPTPTCRCIVTVTARAPIKVVPIAGTVEQLRLHLHARQHARYSAWLSVPPAWRWGMTHDQLRTLFNPEIQWTRASVNQYSGRINVTAD